MELGKKRIMERRKYIRLTLDENAKCKIEDPVKGKSEIAKCNNVSPEGLCITLKKSLKEGIPIHIEVAMKASEPFAIKGEVVWVKEMYDNVTKKGRGKFKVGIKILDIGDDKNRFLLRLCDEMVKKLSQKYPKIKF